MREATAPCTGIAIRLKQGATGSVDAATEGVGKVSRGIWSDARALLDDGLAGHLEILGWRRVGHSFERFGEPYAIFDEADPS